MIAPKIIRRLQSVLPPDCLLLATEDLKPFETDGLTAFRNIPDVVALPETENQVKSILRICHESGTPIVFRGAGTGVSGGALPVDGAVLLAMTRFNRILSIDPLARLARVQPGVRNLAISEAAAPFNLYYAPDPSSQIACTIGGNVAENSGGVHCLKYGLTVHNVLSIRVLTIEGDELVIGSEALDSPGYDLLALLTGSEGMLAVTLEVTVKLLPKPERTQVVLAAFDDIGKGGAAVGAVIAGGVLPAGLEMMDRLAVEAAEAYAHAGYPLNAKAILLVEVDGTQEEVSEDVMRVREILLAAGATEVRTARDEAEQKKFWAGRKAAFPAVGRLAPDYYCMDGTIPRKSLPDVLKRMAALSEQHALPVANVFHAGDGNLHPLILYDANRPGEWEKAERFGADILELCVAHGGSITGEHGVGIEKINQMCVQFGSAELGAFHGIKACFDPDGLLNPGKAVPTLHRCAEYGAMHVRGGKLPFAELPRF
ncbi:MAG: FAD-binding protein [Hydrogenophilaceae bacterium]|nr:FAD-binding protein [Hydrogenophilaceae bacterium]